jgi:hypothetical protein
MLPSLAKIEMSSGSASKSLPTQQRTGICTHGEWCVPQAVQTYFWQTVNLETWKIQSLFTTLMP